MSAADPERKKSDGLRAVARRLPTPSASEALLLALFMGFAIAGKWIADDGYIYLTYVQNLTENGEGAVFNAGERVEAYTSPAWFALLSLLNWLRPASWLDLRQLTLLVSLLASALAAYGLVVVNRRVELAAIPDGGAPRGVNIPLAFCSSMVMFQAGICWPCRST